MKINITLEEALMLDAYKEMRQMAKEDASVEARTEEVSRLFNVSMKLLDSMGIE